jgi:hypothetical protein
MEALRVTQENMKALQNIQEKTALMHQHFLQNQDAALRAFQELAEQQQRLFEESLGLVPSRPIQKARIPVQYVAENNMPFPEMCSIPRQ